jgi:heptosyltransferase III
MTYPMGQLIIKDNPLVARHIIAPQKGIVDALTFARSLRREAYDVVFDFMATPRSAAITRLIPAGERVAFATSRSFLFTKTVAREETNEYIVREKFRLLKTIGIEATDTSMTLPVSETDYDVAKTFMNSWPSLSQSKFRVVLSPTHRRAIRKWPLERWAQLARWLEESKKASVIWIWGPGEEAEIDHVMSLAGGAGVKSPKTSFRELAALISESHLFIGNSNGPSHVAVAMDTPSIQLHGPTKAVSWCPMTERHQAVQRSDMESITLGDVQNLVNWGHPPG